MSADWLQCVQIAFERFKAYVETAAKDGIFHVSDDAYPVLRLSLSLICGTITSAGILDRHIALDEYLIGSFDVGVEAAMVLVFVTIVTLGANSLCRCSLRPNAEWA